MKGTFFHNFHGFWGYNISSWLDYYALNLVGQDIARNWVLKKLKSDFWMENTFHLDLAACRLASEIVVSIAVNLTLTSFLSFKTLFVTGSRTLSTSFGLKAVLSDSVFGQKWRN